MNLYLDTVVNGFSVPLAILLVSAFRRDPHKRWLDVTTAVWYIVFGATAINLAVLLLKTIPHSCDVALLRADHLLGFDTNAFANALSRHWLVMIALIVSYVFLPVVIGMVWLLEQNLDMRRAVFLAGCLCFLFYSVVPAVGPAHFDFATSTPEKMAPYDCFPSMHCTWALLLALNARSQILKTALCGYAGLVIISTLGLREHYLVDVIAAVPYTLAIQWTATRLTVRKPVLALAPGV